MCRLHIQKHELKVKNTETYLYIEIEGLKYRKNKCHKYRNLKVKIQKHEGHNCR